MTHGIGPDIEIDIAGRGWPGLEDIRRVTLRYSLRDGTPVERHLDAWVTLWDNNVLEITQVPDSAPVDPLP